MAARARAAGNDDLAKGVATGERITRALYLQGREIDALKSAAARATDLPIQAQYAAALAVLGDVSLGRSILPRVSKDPETASSGTESVLRAYVSAKDGKTDEAIADLQKAIVQNPRAQELHFMIADLREKSGQDEEAIGGYRLVLRASAFLGTNPVVPGARLRLARLLLKKGDSAGAKEQLDALLAQWKNADTEFPMLTAAKTLRGQIK